MKDNDDKSGKYSSELASERAENRLFEWVLIAIAIIGFALILAEILHA